MSLTAKFTKGDISGHIINMALTNVIGLSVFFIVDLVDIYFISVLNQPLLLSAIGYAAAILFFTTSITIAMMIANSVVVARMIGQQRYQQAKQAAMSCYVLTFIFSLLVSFFIFCNADTLLTFLGATGDELQAASEYLSITLIAFPIVALGMQITSTLRALGRAKLSMYCTITAGVVNIILDPLMIFYFELDLKGAAFASLMAKSTMLLIAVYYLLINVKFITKVGFTAFKKQTQFILKVAIPVSLTQLATPLSQLYITYEIAKFGPSYVAGWAIISRLIPVVFMMLFAMPGAIGPIISQNLGAMQFKRVRKTLNQSLNFIIKYVFVLALTLSLLQEYLISLFNALNGTAVMIRFFCQYISISFIFVAMNLVAMSFLNNVGYPKLASMLNLSKMSLGIIPFVSIGAYYYGVQGILVGQALGSVVFAIISITICYQILRKLDYN